jgi:hypothetical protein
LERTKAARAELQTTMRNLIYKDDCVYVNDHYTSSRKDHLCGRTQVQIRRIYIIRQMINHMNSLISVESVHLTPLNEREAHYNSQWLHYGGDTVIITFRTVEDTRR